MTIEMIRLKTDGQAVHGQVTLPLNNPLVFPTLENAGYLIPAGTYPLRLTYSPRFQKDMPLIAQVPGRQGIRIHMGTKPEHSHGCVLVSYMAIEGIKIFINNYYKTHHDNEELFIRIN